MLIREIIAHLEELAPPSLQESYDNAGLLLGSKDWECTGIITCLDCVEAVIEEAKSKGCNLVVAHHPIIFKGLKKITGSGYIERTVLAAIKNDIAVYAIHTNLDNIIEGVNHQIADRLGLVKRKILFPKMRMLHKLFTYVPMDHAEKVKAAIFAAGGGEIGNYSECSFNIVGKGTFKAEEGADPFVGEIGKRHEEEELKIEIMYPAWRNRQVIKALLDNHPYEEVAYEVIAVENEHQYSGSGLVGELEKEMDTTKFLQHLKLSFDLQVIKHTALPDKPIKRVAVCGGAGSFLVPNALAAGADIFITADMKYHEFFDADGRIVVVDIGHYESEQFTIDLLASVLKEKFPNFAVLKTGTNTNPVRYFL
jgi:dinuclear metal center YbgI/SA1388 family protein